MAVELVPSIRDEKKEHDKTVDDSHTMQEEEYKQRGLIRAVGLFLQEQRSRWILYVFVVAAAAGCGCKFHLSFYESNK